MTTTINPEEEVITGTTSKYNHALVVYDDDVNTFEHVIEVLMRICDHTEEQAEQCAHIVHNNGKCSVKEGDFADLIEMRRRIAEEKIGAQVE
jgi:ATP-dependent Clp protease adaptor protein ClpS